MKKLKSILQKTLMTILISACLSNVGIFPFALEPNCSGGVSATPVIYTVLVNDHNYKLLAYNVEGNAFFKLRDIAMLLNKTLAQFQVEWDETNASVLILTEKAYVQTGGELTLTGFEKAAALQAPPIYVDDHKVNLPGYLIHGNTYQRLNDIIEQVGLDAAVDQSSLTASITGVHTQDYESKDSFALTLGAGYKESLLNGEAVMLSAPCFIKNEAFYFPLESVTNLLGGSYSFKNDTAKVELFGCTTEYRVSSHTMVVNGETFEVAGIRTAFTESRENILIDESFCPVIVDGIVFIPSHFRTHDSPSNRIDTGREFPKEGMTILGSFTNELGFKEVKLDYTYEYLPEKLKAELNYGGVVSTVINYDVEKYYNEDIEIYVMHIIQPFKDLEHMDGKVCAIKVTGSQFCTPRGLKVGDLESSINLLYGTRFNDIFYMDSFYYTAESGTISSITFSSRYYGSQLKMKK